MIISLAFLKYNKVIDTVSEGPRLSSPVLPKSRF